MISHLHRTIFCSISLFIAPLHLTAAVSNYIADTKVPITPIKKKKINAGILPYFYDQSGNAYFLIGRNQSGDWSDFGGAWSLEDHDSMVTATREFSLDTRFLFGKLALNRRPLEQTVCKKDFELLQKTGIDYIIPRITGAFVHPKGYYILYLAEVDFIPADSFESTTTIPSYKKTDFAWVASNDLLNSMNKAKNRWHAYHLGKQINRHLYDVLHAEHHTIRQTINSKKELAI